MTTIEQKNFIEGFVNGVCTDDRCDFYVDSCTEEKDGNMVIHLETVNGVDRQMIDLISKKTLCSKAKACPTRPMSVSTSFSPPKKGARNAKNNV